MVDVPVTGATEPFANGSVRDDVSGRLNARAAVVVVDMQNDFCAPGGYITTAIGKDVSPLAKVIEPIEQVLAAARNRGIPVLWLIARYEDDLLPPSMIAQKRRIGIKAICCAKDTWGADFFGVRPTDGEPVIEKHTYSGFSNPDFGRQLRALGIETLVFCGVQTNVCVESTLREAHSDGFDVVVVSDAVGSHTPPLHEATLTNVRFLFGDVITADELRTHWKAPATSASASA